MYCVNMSPSRPYNSASESRNCCAASGVNDCPARDCTWEM